MWKKEEMPEPMATPRREAPPSYERTAPGKSSDERATIGRSITIHGEVTGDEDLLIQGRVDGSVNLKQHAITVGPEGEVKADITARVITVEGTVKGNLKAQEQAVLRSSAVVEGDITAPRVVLEDGARFRGGVDMGEGVQGGRTGTENRQSKASESTSGASGSADKGASAGTKDSTTPAPARATP
ncbi:MAG TPA: polymer-forming cytoskeletal protein [Longimicrobiales bacterium]